MNKKNKNVRDKRIIIKRIGGLKKKKKKLEADAANRGFMLHHLFIVFICDAFK